MLYICIKFQENISKGFRVGGHILKFTKGHNSIKMLVELWYLFYICLIIFIFEPSFVKLSLRVSELQTQTVGSTLGWLQFTKGHNSIKL